MEDQMRINRETCKVCGPCAEICPSRVMTKDGEGIVPRPDRLTLCFKCRRCMTVCLSRSLSKVWTTPGISSPCRAVLRVKCLS